MKNYSALVDISWLSPTFAPHSVNQLRSLRIVGDGFESTKFLLFIIEMSQPPLKRGLWPHYKNI